MKQKRGTLLIIFGIILIILQLMSIAGNVKAGFFPSLRFDSLGLFLWDLVFLFSYLLVGILGVALIIIGERIYNKHKNARSNKIQNAYYKQQEVTSPNAPAAECMSARKRTQSPSLPITAKDVASLLRRFLSGLLSIAGAIVIIIAMNYQDTTRNEMERVNPSFIYSVFLVLFAVYPVILGLGRKYQSEKPQNAYLMFLIFAVFAMLHEGSVFSGGYFVGNRHFAYAYMETVSALNFIWSAIPLIILLVNQPGLMEWFLRVFGYSIPTEYENTDSWPQ